MSSYVRCVWLGAVLALCACTAAQQKTAQDAASSAPQVAQDAAVAAGVKAKLAGIDVDSATAVHVEVQNGNVTLRGEVRNAAQRKQFEDAARQGAGVKSVVDKTRINGSLRGARESVDDAALAAKVMGSIAAQSGVNAFTVHAAVKAGSVTLTGTVPTQAIKTTVLETARKVNGVKSLTDRISVKE